MDWSIFVAAWGIWAILSLLRPEARRVYRIRIGEIEVEAPVRYEAESLLHEALQKSEHRPDLCAR